MILISGYGNTYGLLPLLFPVLGMMQGMTFHRNTLLLLLPAVLANIPMTQLYAIPSLSYMRLWLILALFVWFCLHFRPVFSMYSAVFPIIAAVYLASGSIYRYETTGNGAPYFLKSEAALLSYTYTLQNDTLSLSIFDEHGPSTKSMALPFKVKRMEAVNPSQYACR